MQACVYSVKMEAKRRTYKAKQSCRERQREMDKKIEEGDRSIEKMQWQCMYRVLCIGNRCLNACCHRAHTSV